MSERSRERRSRMAERHHERRHRHESPTHNDIDDISPGIKEGNDNETVSSEINKTHDVANISLLKDNQHQDFDDIVIPDRALHMEERLYIRGKGHHDSSMSLGSTGSASSILSEGAESNGSRHRRRSHSGSRSHSRDRSNSRDRHSYHHSSKESRHKSTNQRSLHSDSPRKSSGSPLVTENERRSRHEQVHRSIRKREHGSDHVDGSKPGVSSSLKVSHRISSMARPPRLDTRNSLRISIPNRQSVRKSTASSSSDKSDKSINALMDEMRQMMTGTPLREPMSPFAKELSILEKVQKDNEGNSSSLVDSNIDRIKNKLEGSNKRNSKASYNPNMSLNSIDLWKKAEERQFRFSTSYNEENIGQNIENLKKELEELAIDKEKRKSRLSMNIKRISTGSTAKSSTNRSSKYDDSYLKTLLGKLSDTKASKRYSQRNSRLLTDIVKKSINVEDNKKEEPEVEKEEPKVQDANDEENNKLLASLQESEEKFESLNKDLNSLLFNSIKLFDNLILS